MAAHAAPRCWLDRHARKLSVGNALITDSFLAPPASPYPGWLARISLTPALSAPWMFRKLAHAEHLYAGFCDRVIVLDRAATYPYGPNENPILIHDGQSAREVINPSFECSMQKSGLPGWDSLPS